MTSFKWTESEKKIARKAFFLAYRREFDHSVPDSFRQKSLVVSDPEDLWALEDFLVSARRNMESKYDYRYSRLVIVFGILLPEGWVRDDDLSGLAPDKMAGIRHLAELRRSDT